MDCFHRIILYKIECYFYYTSISINNNNKANMTAIYKTYEQMGKECPDGGAYVEWARKETADKGRGGMTVQYDQKNDDGSTTKVFSSFNSKVSNDRIDGHFWLEDMNGKIVSDCGFNSYKHKLPCFNDKSFYNPDTDFLVYQPVPDAVMEQEIIDLQVNKTKANWGGALNQIVGCFEDKRSTDDRFKTVARQMWKDKAKMLERGFECLQHSVCEHLYRTEKGEQVRIRFGCAGIVRPSADMVFWFFGHLDNTKISEWIVKDAVSADGKSEKKVLHDRKMRISEVPNAKKVMDERVIKRQVFNAAKELVRKRKAEQETERADRAAEALLAEWEGEEQPKQKKQKKNKNNKKK